MAPGTHRLVPPQSLLAMSPEKRKLAAQEGQPTEPLPEEQAKEKLHTLETFSYKFFRCPPSPNKHYQAQPQSTLLYSLRALGRPQRQVWCPPGEKVTLRASHNHPGGWRE